MGQASIKLDRSAVANTTDGKPIGPGYPDRVRFVWLLVLAGCGRSGFGESSSGDATVEIDSSGEVDAAIDAPGGDTVFYIAFEDDPTDGTIDDTSGHGYSASCVVGLTCPTQTPGVRGAGVRFNGTQFALIPHRAALSTPNAYTVAAWVYIEVAGDQVAVGKPVSTGARDSWALVAWSMVNMMTCLETTSSSLSEWACSPVVLPIGTWYHLAGTYDGSTKRIYINGSIAGSIAGTTTDMDSNDIVVGGDQNSGVLAYAWRGRLDELRFYDRALTTAELQVLAAP